MRIVKQLKAAADYWQEMVEPDYRECLNKPADLRAAFHAAISLFHMHDWIWKTHEASVRASFIFTDGKGLDNQSPRHGIIRQRIGTAMRGFRSYPWHRERGQTPYLQGQASSERTEPCRQDATGRIGGYFGGFYGNYFGRYFGHATMVMLEGTNGNDMKFSDVARAVYEMWGKLRTTHGW